MLSINTNLSSLITQNSMKTSTDKLNQAIEKMTTGFKINHAKDNAANYSISTNLTTQLSAYDTAADNVAMGMDLVNYASDTISQMQDKAARLNALSTQARNGTYGAQSLSALNSEANAIMSELMRLYSTAEYNDISLFNRTTYELTPEHKALTESLQNNVVAKEEYNGFITDPKHPNGDAYVDGLTSVTEAIATGSLTSGGEYKVGGVDDLKALATYVNSGNNTSGMTFIMSEDIDLSGEVNWTPIGDYSTDTSSVFKGIFDGNGHVIKNLKIDRETSNYQGLFGYAQDGEIKNIGLENVDIKGQSTVGGLAGYASSSISNGYATGNVNGTERVGGLAGYSEGIRNSYTTGNINSFGDYVGGLAGYSEGSIHNSYTTGNINSLGDYVGGLAGTVNSSVINSYATGNVSGTSSVGGLVGYTVDSISNSYATGNVNGTERVGGLVGEAEVGNISIVSSFAKGNVEGISSVGGLIGYTYEGDDSHVELLNSYAMGDVIGQDFVAGIIGKVETYSDPYDDLIINNCASYSQSITGDEAVGSIIGGWVGEEINGWYTPGTLIMSNNMTISTIQGIGNYYTYDDDSGDYTLDPTYDLSSYNSAVKLIQKQPIETNLQVGIYGNNSSQLNFNTNFSFDLNIDTGIESIDAFNAIVAFENLLSEKATQLGAVQNRLDSALESIEVNINNLTSTRSTIRDADIAEVSSQYIQQQILQQAAATLMATANQSPSIALQLI